MKSNTITFSFDYGCCLWQDGCGIFGESLPISSNLKKEVDSLCQEFSGSLDWDYPPDPSPWTREEFIHFFDKAEIVCKKLVNELGPGYTVINRIEQDRRMYMDNRVFAPSQTT